MGSRKLAIRFSDIVMAAERIFWAGLIAGLVTAVFSFVEGAILTSLPNQSGDDEWALLALISFPLIALVIGGVGGIIASFRSPQNLRAWLTGGLIPMGGCLLLGLLAFIPKLFVLSDVSALCWILISITIIPASAAVCSYIWLSQRSPRGILWSRIAAITIFLLIAVTFAATGFLQTAFGAP